MEEEYEIIPTSPIRRLEQRLSKIETTTSSSEVNRLIEQIIELIKSNQRVIDDVIKSDAELRNEVSKVPGKIEQLISKMDDFLELIRASATEEAVSEVSKDVFKPLEKKMSELVDETKKTNELTQASLSSLGVIDKRLKRIYLQFAGASGATGESGENYKSSY
jgi:hypothetical protein